MAGGRVGRRRRGSVAAGLGAASPAAAPWHGGQRQPGGRQERLLRPGRARPGPGAAGRQGEGTRRGWGLRSHRRGGEEGSSPRGLPGAPRSAPAGLRGAGAEGGLQLGRGPAGTEPGFVQACADREEQNASSYQPFSRCSFGCFAGWEATSPWVLWARCPAACCPCSLPQDADTGVWLSTTTNFH